MEDTEVKLLDEYVARIAKLAKSLKKFGINTVRDEVTLREINQNLAEWEHNYIDLCAEYRRKKTEHEYFKKEFKKWYDIKFIEVKSILMDEYKSKSTKPPLKEYETELRVRYSEEYDIYEYNLLILEEEVAMYKRIVDGYKTHAENIRAIGSNLKAEMN